MFFIGMIPKQNKNNGIIFAWAVLLLSLSLKTRFPSERTQNISHSHITVNFDYISKLKQKSSEKTLKIGTPVW